MGKMRSAPLMRLRRCLRDRLGSGLMKTLTTMSRLRWRARMALRKRDVPMLWGGAGTTQQLGANR